MPSPGAPTAHSNHAAKINSARWPVQWASGEEVHVQMRDGFTAVGAVVYDEAETGLELEFFRQGAGGE